MPWRVPQILPVVVVAGQDAGKLSEEGARLLDPTGALRAGTTMAPPEGDAGTGMVATCSVSEHACSASLGTSSFAMIVMEHSLRKLLPGVDQVTTPSGRPVAMVHTNNCTADFDAWVGVLAEVVRLTGGTPDLNHLYKLLLEETWKGDESCVGLVSYNFLSGEGLFDLKSGSPLFARTPGTAFTLSKFVRTLLFSAFAPLCVGMNRLIEGEEGLRVDEVMAHGGIFATEGIAQQVLANALNRPVRVNTFAARGGAWGMALLAVYTARVQAEGGRTVGELSEFLRRDIFGHDASRTLRPTDAGVKAYAEWLAQYRSVLPVEQLASRSMGKL